MEFEMIRLDIDGGIATITMNRPERMNAFMPQTKDEIIAALDITDAADDVRVVIVTGAGRAFCAGADLSGGGRRFDPDSGIVTRRDGGGQLALRIFDSHKPVIAAINGPAVGVGATITLPMDIRVASDTARFAFPFTRRGVNPDGCASWFMPRLVGIARTSEWFTTGRTFGAQEALEAGLVHSVHPQDKVLDAAREIAQEIIENTAPVSVALTRKLIWRMLTASHPMEAHIAESIALSAQGASSDAFEGITSFLEKRKPQFDRTVSADLPDVFPDWQEPEFS